MRRPVSVKPFFDFFFLLLDFFVFQIVPIEPSRLRRHPSRGEVGPGLSRSHLISAVELGCLDTISFFLCPFFFLPVFSIFHREISSQDRLGTTIVNSVDPEHPLFCGEFFTLGRAFPSLNMVQLALWPELLQTLEKAIVNRKDSTCEDRLSQIYFERRYVHCEHIKRSGRGFKCQ
jgi:hypothetical protein